MTLNAVQIVMCTLTSVQQLAPLSTELSRTRLSSQSSSDNASDWGFDDATDGDTDGQLEVDIESLVRRTLPGIFSSRTP